MFECIRTRGGGVALTMVALALALAGCSTSSLRLYSPSLDEQGKKAQKAYADADVLGFIPAERERSSALLKAEMAYIADQPLFSRDVKLYRLLTGPGSGGKHPDLGPVVSAGYAGLVGDGTFYANLTAARTKATNAKNQYDTAATEFRRSGLELPSCTEVLSPEFGKDYSKELQERLLDEISNAKAACTKTPTSDMNAVQALTKCAGKTGKALTDCTAGLPRLQAELETLYALEAAQDTQRTAHATARNELRVASAEYTRLSNSPEGNEHAPETAKAKPLAAAAPAASGASAPAAAASAAEAGPTRTKLTAALERLRTAVDKVKKYDDKLSLKLVSEDRLSAIDEALGALLAPKAAGAEGETDKDRAGRALQRLADTADAWAATKASAGEVLQRPLLAQQQVERLQVQALNRSMAVDATNLELQRTLASLTEQQAIHYKKAVDSLNGLSFSDKGLQALIYETGTGAADQDKRAKAMEGVAHYGYAVGYLQGQYQSTKLQQQALVTTRQLDLAENSLRQWDTLIHTNVDLLAAWAATGVKEETISRGINALLLLWIGYGTNHP